MPRRSRPLGPTASTTVAPRLEAAELTGPESLAKKLQEALLLAKLEDFQREGVKALPLSATNCAIEFHADLETAFTVVDIATNYDFSNLSSLEVDERNAQQFVEQLGPGKRPLWAVPVILRPKTAGLVLEAWRNNMGPAVSQSQLGRGGSVRSHLAKSSAVKELKNWTLRNSRNIQVTFLSQDTGHGPQLILGGTDLAIRQLQKKPKRFPEVDEGPGLPAAKRAERELLEAEDKEKARQLKRREKAREVATSHHPVSAEATTPSECSVETPSTNSETPSDAPNSMDSGSTLKPSILQLLSGWLGSVRAEESCHKVVNVNYWHYRRNENACWRLSYLENCDLSSDRCSQCLDRPGCLCNCTPNPWLPLPELEPDGREPQLLTTETMVEPPGLEPELADTAVWRHLLRGTHGFSLDGPEPVSLFPEAPDLARTARLRQRNAGWRRWWVSHRKQRQAEAMLQESDMHFGKTVEAEDFISYNGQTNAPSTMVFMPVPVHLCWKVKFTDNFFLLRGNHECASINRIYGFYDECKRRYSIRLWKTFTDCFNCLPVSAVIEDKIVCMHGGLSPELGAPGQINRVIRPTDVPDTGLLCDLLWSDPEKEISGWGENDRGVSFTFGPDVVHGFLRKHQLDLVCRAHQVVEDGYEFFACRALVTLFSAPNYCGEFDNSAAIMTVDDRLCCAFQILRPMRV
eukprot:symbB.v1.2.018377.t4/scaffold1465.1/size117142/1